MSGLKLLSRWLLLGEWRAHPVRAVLAVAAIAVGAPTATVATPSHNPVCATEYPCSRTSSVGIQL